MIAYVPGSVVMCKFYCRFWSISACRYTNVPDYRMAGCKPWLSFGSRIDDRLKSTETKHLQLSLLALLDQVLEAVDVPVLAVGGK